MSMVMEEGKCGLVLKLVWFKVGFKLDAGQYSLYCEMVKYCCLYRVFFLHFCFVLLEIKLWEIVESSHESFFGLSFKPLTFFFEAVFRVGVTGL